MRCWLCDKEIEGEPIVHREVVTNGRDEEEWVFNLCSRECEIVFMVLFHVVVMGDEDEVMMHLEDEHGLEWELVEEALKKFEEKFSERERRKILKKKVRKLEKKIEKFALRGDGIFSTLHG